MEMLLPSPWSSPPTPLPCRSSVATICRGSLSAELHPPARKRDFAHQWPATPAEAAPVLLPALCTHWLRTISHHVHGLSGPKCIQETATHRATESASPPRRPAWNGRSNRREHRTAWIWVDLGTLYVLWMGDFVICLHICALLPVSQCANMYGVPRSPLCDTEWQRMNGTQCAKVASPIRCPLSLLILNGAPP